MALSIASQTAWFGSATSEFAKQTLARERRKMLHDLKIGAVVAVTFLSAIGAAATYRQSVQPGWQPMESLAIAAEADDGNAPLPPRFPAIKPDAELPPALPTSPGNVAPPPLDASWQDSEKAKPKKTNEATLPGKQAKIPEPLPRQPERSVEKPVPAVGTQAVELHESPAPLPKAKALPPPIPPVPAADPKGSTKSGTQIESVSMPPPVPTPSVDAGAPAALPLPGRVEPVEGSAKAGVVDESKKLKLPPPMAPEFKPEPVAKTPAPVANPFESPPKPSTTKSGLPDRTPTNHDADRGTVGISGNRETIRESAVAATSSATLGTASKETPPASPQAASSPNMSESGLLGDEGNVVARSRPAPRDVERTMSRPPLEASRVIAVSAATTDKKSEKSVETSQGREPPGVGGGAIAAVGRSPKPVVPEQFERIDAGGRAARFDVVGDDRPGEEFVPVRRMAQPTSAVRQAVATEENSGWARRVNWDSPELKAIVAPINTSNVAIRSYDAQVYVVLDGDTFDRIAESMYWRRGLGGELARYNRSRYASNEPLPVASRILLPPISELTANARTGSPTASAPPADRGSDPPSKEKTEAKPSPPPLLPSAPSIDPTAGVDAASPARTETPGSAAAIPVAKPAVPGNRPESQPVMPVSAKTPERGIDPPPPTLRRGPVDSAESLKRSDAGDGPTYTVRQPDETLYGIARRFLGDGRRFREIYQLNADKLANEYDLPVGITLRLPADANRKGP